MEISPRGKFRNLEVDINRVLGDKTVWLSNKFYDGSLVLLSDIMRGIKSSSDTITVRMKLDGRHL